MTSIVVSAEQAEIIKNSPTGVELRDPKGKCLGVFQHHGVSEEDIQIALQRRASGGPYVPMTDVLKHLQSLESRERRECDSQ